MLIATLEPARVSASLLAFVTACFVAPSAAQAKGDDTLGAIRSPTVRQWIQARVEAESGDPIWKAAKTLSAAGSYPIVEELLDPDASPPGYVQVTFVHRASGTADATPNNVLLFTNINHVLPSELLFERIGDSDMYIKTVEVPRGSRFEYRIIENDPLTGLFAGAKYGTRLHVLGGDPDPLNPNKQVFPDGLGEGQDYIKTWVELPEAAPQPYIADLGNPRGTLRSEERHSATLGYTHQIRTFLPPGYDPEQRYPLLILFDGGSYFERGPLQLTLENLIAQGAIPPLVVLGIDAGVKDGQTQRNDEFTCNPKFKTFLNQELLPWFTSRVSVATDPRRRIIAGSSFGGLFATYFAFHHPETVANVLSQSGSFHWGAGSFDWGREENGPRFETLIRQFAFADKKPISIYMEVGKLEGEYSWGDPWFPNQLVSHQHFKTVLEMKGYDVAHHEYAGGHEMLSWRGGIADGLKHLFDNMKVANGSTVGP